MLSENVSSADNQQERVSSVTIGVSCEINIHNEQIRSLQKDFFRRSTFNYETILRDYTPNLSIS